MFAIPIWICACYMQPRSVIKQSFGAICSVNRFQSTIWTPQSPLRSSRLDTFHYVCGFSSVYTRWTQICIDTKYSSPGCEQYNLPTTSAGAEFVWLKLNTFNTIHCLGIASRSRCVFACVCVCVGVELSTNEELHTHTFTSHTYLLMYNTADRTLLF